MADTQVLGINATSVTTSISTTVQGVVNAYNGLTKGSSTLSSLLALATHDHCALVSNSNGYALKFDNGEMICWNEIQKGSATMTTAAANACYGGESYTKCDATFPVAFTSTPVVVSNVESTVLSNTQVSSVSTTSCHMRHWTNYSTSTGTTNFSYIAIGKWK